MQCYAILCFIFTLILHVSHAHRKNGNQLDQENCGIIGKHVPKEESGVAIQPQQYPWLALVGQALGEVFSLRCVGSLISKKYAISSAWCMGKTTSTLPTHVRLGEYDIRTQSKDLTNPVDYYIVSYKTPGFIRITEENDLALIELDREVIYTENIRPACLPYNTENMSFEDLKLYMVGYSRHSTYLKTSQDRSASIPIGEMMVVTNFEKCLLAYAETDQSLSDKNMCFEGSKTDICPSTIDGPLHYYDGSTGKYMILGLVTNIPSKCTKTDRSPAVLTKISNFLTWLEDNVE